MEDLFEKAFASIIKNLRSFLNACWNDDPFNQRVRLDYQVWITRSMKRYGDNIKAFYVPAQRLGWKGLTPTEQKNLWKMTQHFTIMETGIQLFWKFFEKIGGIYINNLNGGMTPLQEISYHDPKLKKVVDDIMKEQHINRFVL